MPIYKAKRNYSALRDTETFLHRFGSGRLLGLSLGFDAVQRSCMFDEICHVVESWIVQLEGLEEPFCLALHGRLSMETHDVLYTMGFQVGCELASSMLTIELRSMIAQDLSRDSSLA